MIPKLRISLSTESRKQVLQLADRPNVVGSFKTEDARKAAISSSLWIQQMARKRQQDSQIDQAIRSTPV
jgi:hypothetical protein